MSGEMESCELINPVVNSLNLCTGELEYDFYDYNVRKWTASLFVALFAATTLLHIAQGIRSRRWFTFATIIICCISETLGWSARLWSAISTTWAPEMGGYWYSNETAFLMQISTLIFAPAFLAAFWYLLLGRIIKLIGPQYCRFTMLAYTVIFCSGDAISIVIQAVGGGTAAGADTSSDADNGAKIMVAGVFIQVAVSVLYCLVLAEFVIRYIKQAPVKQFRFRRTANKADAVVPAGSVPKDVERQVRILLGAMIFSTVLVFVRSIYRAVELLNGWSGPIISNQTYFDVLDATMVFVALFTLNVFHPMWWLPSERETRAPSIEKKELAESDSVV